MNTIMDDEDEISILQWFQWKLLTLDKNWSAFTENISITAVGLISASLVTAVLTWILTKDNVSNQATPSILDNTKSVGNSTSQNIQKEGVDLSGSNLRNRRGNGNKTTTMGVESSNLNKNMSQENENQTKDPSSQSTISRVKQAKHAAISKAITEKLTKEEIEEEKRIQREQLAKIYSLLADNENEMGKMTYEELQSQMSMYTV